jgi:hypothetical protein
MFREIDKQMAEEMAVIMCTKTPASVLKKGLMVCASNDILFSGGDTGSSLPEVKKPVLPKELTSKFGALKCDLCKVSVSLLNLNFFKVSVSFLNLNFLRRVSSYSSCRY